MKVELFKIDPNTRMVDLNKEWISTIKEFKKILSRDRGSKGDNDGKKKLFATKEFTFIYHYCDYASKFDNYAEDDKLKECLLNAELPVDLDYKKDEDLLAAIIRYKSMQDSATLKLLNEAKEGLHSTHKLIRKIRIALESQIEATDFAEFLTQEKETTDETKSNSKKIDDPITKMIKAYKGLIEITNSVGPVLRNIKELEEDVKKELGDKASLRGGKEKGIREDAGDQPTREPALTGANGMFADLI